MRLVGGSTLAFCGIDDELLRRHYKAHVFVCTHLQLFTINFNFCLQRSKSEMVCSFLEYEMCCNDLMTLSQCVEI